MGYKSFNQWLLKENKDLFGFESKIKKAMLIEPETDKDKPINRFNIEELTDYLSTIHINNKECKDKSVNEVIWGNEVENLRVKIMPDMHLEIARKTNTLEGHPVWITKKVFQINRTGFGGKEVSAAQDIIKELENIDKSNQDSPKHEFKIDNLILKLISELKIRSKEIFLYEGTKKINNGNFIIKFGVRGNGVEYMGHQRVEENQTQVIFDKDNGIIKILNFNIISPVGGPHSWNTSLPKFEFYFTPTQSISEIVDSVTQIMKWY